MKNEVILLFFGLMVSTLFAQKSTYPQGLYMTFEEVINKNPSQHDTIILEERSKGKIKMNGGNDYQLNAVDKSTSRKFLRNEVYAYSNEQDLFLNAAKYELQTWYSKVEGENENYFWFKAGIPTNMKRYGLKSNDISYLFGGIVAGFSAAKKALIRLPYLLNKNTQEVILVSDKNMEEIMKESTDLVSAYQEEKDKNNPEVLNKYLEQWINRIQ